MIINVIDVNVFERLSRCGVAVDLCDAFIWEKSREGDNYWRTQARTGTLNQEAWGKVKHMYEIAKSCVHRVETNSKDDMDDEKAVINDERVEFINTLEGHATITNGCVSFSDEKSAIVFKMRFG